MELIGEGGIIPIHDYGEIDRRLFLVMPIIKGDDVQAVLKRDGPMTPERAVRVIEQLASARWMLPTRQGWCTATSSHPMR